MKAKGEGLTFETIKWAEQLRKDYAQFEFDTGIIEDKPEPLPKYGEHVGKQIGGISPLKKGSKSGTMVSEVAKRFEEAYNWLISPWRKESNRDVLAVITDYSRYLAKPGNDNRLRNAIQAVIRNPILRGEYGDNRAETAKKKGFNKLMVATGTFFNSIKAVVKRRGR